MIFDGHSDLLCALGRNLRRGGDDGFARDYRGAFASAAVEGGVFVLWSDPAEGRPAAAQLEDELRALELVSARGEIAILRAADDIEASRASGTLYGLLGVEGLDGWPASAQTVEYLYALGARHLGLTWNFANAYASGVQAAGGLTALGRATVREAERRRMLLDVSHLNDASFWEVLSLAEGPVIASHSNSRRLCGAPRNLTDDQARAVAVTGGVIGLNSHPAFLDAARERQTLSRLCDHIVYLAELVGTEQIGLGLDLNYWSADDTEEVEELTALRRYRGVDALCAELRGRGFGERELSQLLRDNFLRLVRWALD